MSLVQEIEGSFEQVVDVSGLVTQAPYSKVVHVAKPRASLPQTERAAQRFSLPLQFVGRPSFERSLTTWATQLT